MKSVRTSAGRRSAISNGNLIETLRAKTKSLDISMKIWFSSHNHVGSRKYISRRCWFSIVVTVNRKFIFAWSPTTFSGWLECLLEFRVAGTYVDNIGAIGAHLCWFRDFGGTYVEQNLRWICGTYVACAGPTVPTRLPRMFGCWNKLLKMLESAVFSEGKSW